MTLLAGGLSREEAEEYEDWGDDHPLSELADALEAIRESGGFSLFTSDDED